MNAHEAAWTGDARALAAALARDGQAKDARDGYGETPLHHAARNGRKECVELLLRAGADKHAKWDATPLHYAAREGHKECVELLLRAGADKDAKKKDGWTPLHLAAQNGHKECVELLLRAGADKDAKDEDGWTPLHWAAAYGRKECVELLVAHGADPAAKTTREWEWDGRKYPAGSTPADVGSDDELKRFLSELPRTFSEVISTPFFPLSLPALTRISQARSAARALSALRSPRLTPS
jgi:ankyrin repeat protein